MRFRRDISCPAHECDRLAAREGDLTTALHEDGAPVSMPSFDSLAPHRFDITCPAGHTIALHFPKDLMAVKTPDAELSDVASPAVMRT